MKKQKLSYRDIASLCMELSMFLHAGLPCGGALYYLADETEDSSMKESLLRMGAAADEGVMLSEVFRESGLFPNDVCAMLRVGEQTGKNEETLIALSRYYDRLDMTDKQMRSALLYPSVLMLVMISVVILLLAYVLPIFNDVYATLGGGLEGVAKLLLSIGNILRNIIPLLCIAAILAVGFLVLFSSSQSFRSRLSGMSGDSDRGVSKKINAARFAGALSMAISGGLTSEEAIEMAGTLLSSARAIERSRICLDKIAEGVSLTDALHQSGLMPSAECRLLALGLQGGSADTAAAEIARRLERDADDALESAVSKTEPIMVIVSSLLIGGILLSVMLPLTHIMSTIG